MKLLSQKTLIVAIIVLVAIVATVIYTQVHPPKFEKSNKKENAAASLAKIKVGYSIQGFDSVPVIVAYEKGYFRDQGLDVELIQVSSKDAAVALASGQLDIVVIGPPRVYNPIEKGAPIRMLSPIASAPTKLFIRPDSNINSFKDLEGKAVSYGTPGGTKELFLRYILKKENTDLKKINFVDMDSQYEPSMLMEKKKIDAALIQNVNEIDIAKKLGAVIMPAWQTNGYDTSLIGLPVSTISSIIAANTDYLNGHEENARSFFKALIEAHRYLKEHQEESSAMIAKYFKDNSAGATDMKPDQFENLVKEGRQSYSLWEDTSIIVEMARIDYELGKIGHPLALNEMYDFRFKDMLESAQNEIYGTTKN